MGRSPKNVKRQVTGVDEKPIDFLCYRGHILGVDVVRNVSVSWAYTLRGFLWPLSNEIRDDSQ